MVGIAKNAIHKNIRKDKTFVFNFYKNGSASQGYLDNRPLGYPEDDMHILLLHKTC